jgi:hypothetical protein
MRDILIVLKIRSSMYMIQHIQYFLKEIKILIRYQLAQCSISLGNIEASLQLCIRGNLPNGI